MTTPAKHIFLEALRMLLRPVARYAIRNGIELRETLEMLKRATVDAAIEELQSEQEVSVSRLAIVTGVHRKDVTRILNTAETLPREQSITARVLSEWRTNPNFINSLGQPRILSVTQPNEFAALVRSVSRELNATIFLKELERVGAVRMTKLGVKLFSSAYVPVNNFKRALSILARGVSDFFEAVQENLLGDQKLPNIHITTQYDAIGDSQVEKARAWLLQEGTKMHERAQTFLSSLDSDTNQKLEQGGERNRVAFTTFSFIEKNPHK